MCERYSTLRCREIINVSDGCRLGYVGDLELDLESGRVLALIVPGRGRLFGLLAAAEEYVIPWACIRRIGEDIILVDVCLEEVKRPKAKKGIFF